MQNSKFFSKIGKAVLPPCSLLRKSQSLHTQLDGLQWLEVLMSGRILTMLSSSSVERSELDTLRKTSAGQLQVIGELNGR